MCKLAHLLAAWLAGRPTADERGGSERAAKFTQS